MKAYLATTATLFGILTVVHIWRATVETHLVTDPFFILITAASTVLCIWGVRLLRS
jgi:hypothetical protein